MEKYSVLGMETDLVRCVVVVAVLCSRVGAVEEIDADGSLYEEEEVDGAVLDDRLGGVDWIDEPAALSVVARFAAVDSLIVDANVALDVDIDEDVVVGDMVVVEVVVGGFSCIAHSVSVTDQE